MRMTLGVMLGFSASLFAIAAVAAPPTGIKLEHPGDTAVSQDDSGKFIYKSFPGLGHLFVFDGDRPGKSNCNEGCASAWPPLIVSDVEKSPRVGDWTKIRRDDGTEQWAYKGRPVYTRFHNFEPDDSTEKEGFHLLIP